ncbi:hypothetical protein TI39_contig379g00013 [Zymoseptoria brevis]|uniref:Uncharacterized protein n=1 Tax=Zymoseptoria brevis TaxID=1047168 RepID=A0A0F4GS33_9PEZI|nr:hypothetical protein TI39_contig379g00013 [Zymoseptoria brevis]
MGPKRAAAVRGPQHTWTFENRMAAYILCYPIDQYAASSRKPIFDHIYGSDIGKTALTAQARESQKLQRDHPDATNPKRHADWDRITRVPLSRQDQITWDSILQRIGQAIEDLELGELEPQPAATGNNQMQAPVPNQVQASPAPKFVAHNPTIANNFVHKIELFEAFGIYIWRPNVLMTPDQRSINATTSTTILPEWVWTAEDTRRQLLICFTDTCATCRGRTGEAYLTDQEIRWIETRDDLPPQFWQRHKIPNTSTLTVEESRLMDDEEYAFV